ncbi:MAG: DUF2934 domain-containing protein [Verrucomicrobia bacterium]|nr:DUF2934 domain-containing protein [Verrucomicrobiota bacterium]
MTQQMEEQIRTRAYYLWEADGCPQGRDWEYWMKATQELELQSEASAAPGMAASRKKSSNTEGRSPSASKRRNGNRAPAYA